MKFRCCFYTAPKFFYPLLLGSFQGLVINQIYIKRKERVRLVLMSMALALIYFMVRI